MAYTIAGITMLDQDEVAALPQTPNIILGQEQVTFWERNKKTFYIVGASVIGLAILLYVYYELTKK